MNPAYHATALVTLLLVTGCGSTSTPRSITLHCQAREGVCFSFYSFTRGALTLPPDHDHVDILYYFDADDCVQGAIIGHDDHPGYLFPIGHRTWKELASLEPPQEGTESVGGITPLTKDQEGLAFWVKTAGGRFYLARIKTVHPSSHPDLLAGQTATLELEWFQPRILKEK